MNRSLFARLTLLGVILVSLLALPLLILLPAGLVYLQQQGWLLTSSIIWLSATLMLVAGIAWYQHRLDYRRSLSARPNPSIDPHTDPELSQALEKLPERLQERAEWSDAERQLWHHGVQQIETALRSDRPAVGEGADSNKTASGPAWDLMPSLGLMLLADTANAYQTLQAGRPQEHWQISRFQDHIPDQDFEQLIAQLRFSVPELLLVCSLACTRYRQLLLQYLPFAEEITLARAATVYKHQGRLRTGARWANRLRRTVRLVNPMSALVGELREQLSQQLILKIGDKVETDLKRLMLQELLQVAMDLNSGRLKHMSQQSDIDTAPQPAGFEQDNVDALRVLVVGQANSGKSSLINAIADELHARVDVLPDTHGAQVHEFVLDDQLPLSLIEAPALDSDQTQTQDLLNTAMETDLILHTIKATQPARAADQALVEQLAQRYEKEPLRKTPPTVVVMTHCDQLSPKAEWDPPYDLEDGRVKSVNIRQALTRALAQAGYPAEATAAVPTCLSSRREPYNIEAIIATVFLLQNEARRTQRNREQWLSTRQGSRWADTWSRLNNLGRVLGRAVAG